MTKSKLISSKTGRALLHADEFKTEMMKITDASIGVVIIRTREAARCQEVLQEWAATQEMSFKVWTVLNGWLSYPSLPVDEEDLDTNIDYTKSNHKDGSVAVPLAFEKVQNEFDDKGCYIFMNLQHYFEAPGVQQHIKDRVRDALDNEKRVVIIVPETAKIPTEIEDDLHIVDFKTPSHAELRVVWEELLETISDGKDDEPNCRPNFNKEDVDLIVQNALGMSSHELDTALAIAFVELRNKLVDKKRSVTPQDFIDVIMQHKIMVIKKTDILELLPAATMKEVGGLDILKSWVGKRAKAFSDEAREFGVDMPRGVLMVGPPGTGKSLAARAVGSVLQVPCIKMDIGAIFGQFVGQSEGRMRKGLSLVEAMAPCVLMVDEIDKGFGGMGGSSDSGTTSRVFGTFLTWMQERQANNKPIFVVMTANNVVGLPPELMRRGRLDEIFAVTFPSDAERSEILRIHIEKRKHKLTKSDINLVARNTKNFVGSELEAVVKDALVEAFSEGEDLTVKHLLAQANSIIPLYKAFGDKVQAMSNWAKQNAKSASSEATLDYDDEPKKSSGKSVIRRGTKRRKGRRLKPSSFTSEN